MDEFAAIARFFRPLSEGRPEALNLLDDASLITPPPGKQLVITTDALQENIHFFSDDAPRLIAKKALRVNLSDLAAKGADPLCYFMTLGLPPRVDAAWLEAFVAGLAEDQQRYGVFLAGGDTTNSEHSLSISITLLGTVPNGEMVPRLTAQSSDFLYITGTIGDAALGLKVRHGDATLSGKEREFLLQRYLLPEPRNGCIEVLRSVATAAMDISDGFVQDVQKFCGAGLGLDIALTALPFSPAAQSWLSVTGDIAALVAGGDDYELLFSVAPCCKEELLQAAHDFGFPVTCLGTLIAQKPVRFLDASGSEMEFSAGGYRHHIA